MSSQAENIRKQTKNSPKGNAAKKKNPLDNAALNIGIKQAAPTIEEKPIEQTAATPAPVIEETATQPPAAPVVEPTEPQPAAAPQDETPAKEKALKAEWPRINISFSPENYGLIKALMGKQKATAATVVNRILDGERERRPELKAIIDFFTND